MTTLEVGVCGWCLDRHDLIHSIEVASRQLAVSCMQIGFFTTDDLRAVDANTVASAAEAVGMSLVGSFVGFDGEDYSSIERIALTGGFTADETYAARLVMTRVAAEVTRILGGRSLAMHAGTIPSDAKSPLFTKLVARIREVADILEECGLRLLLETGSEPADIFLDFLNALEGQNIGVNFDPGNFIVYGTDEPAQAFSKLKQRVENVHLKDAVRSARPGIEYGRAVPLGLGDAQIPRIVSTLRLSGYAGPLLVEIPAREDVRNIRCAIDDLRAMIGWNERPGAVRRKP